MGNVTFLEGTGTQPAVALLVIVVPVSGEIIRLEPTAEQGSHGDTFVHFKGVCMTGCEHRVRGGEGHELGLEKGEGGEKRGL